MADYQLPEECRYSKDDEWVRTEGDRLRVGITDYAQQQLGDIVFVELPDVGGRFEAGQTFGVIESVKAVSDLFCPVGGEVVAVNEALEDAPETVNESCYGEGWLIEISAPDPAEVEALMDSAAYAKFVAERED